jgi:dTDP-4-dehydrorhamnose 3,5-epimerase
MNFERTPLQGLTVVVTEPRGDRRGRLVRVFCAQQFAALRPPIQWVQVNLSRTTLRGTVRGLHLQRPPAAEAKLIRCVRGAVFDVAVDLRAGSPTFLQWHGVELDACGEREVLIPEGFAHGFQALTDEVELLYLHSAAYAPEHEGGVRFDDPRLAIDWPLPVAQVSERDAAWAPIDDHFEGVRL